MSARRIAGLALLAIIAVIWVAGRLYYATYPLLNN